MKRLRLRLQTKKALPRSTKYDVKRLQLDDIRQQFTEKLQERFDSLVDHSVANETDIEREWSYLKSTVQKTALDVLGRSKSKLKDWISQVTINLSKETEIARNSNNPAYKALRRETSRSAKRDRRKYWDDMATYIQQAE